MPSAASRNPQQFYLENERRAAGYAWLRESSVAHLGRDVDFPLVADTHLLHCHYPSLYEVAQAEGDGRAAAAAVELLPVYRPPSVVGGDDAAGRGMLAIGLAFTDYLIIDTLRKSLAAAIPLACRLCTAGC